jgi:hypothetical protein
MMARGSRSVVRIASDRRSAGIAPEPSRPRSKMARTSPGLPPNDLKIVSPARLYMDTHDMTADGQLRWSRFPSVPMTTAADVASELFGRAPEGQPSFG